MKIAVIGTGHIGGTLGQRWHAAGHDVAYGSRKGSGTGPGGAPVMPVADALTGAEVVLLAVPGRAVAEVVAAHGAALGGKVVIDAVNRIGEPDVNSQAAIAAAAPDARYVRAFNTLGWENFAGPPRARRCSSPPTPARARPPRNLSPRLGWSRSSPATPARAERSMPCWPCGSHWSSTTAGTAGSRCASRDSPPDDRTPSGGDQPAEGDLTAATVVSPDARSMMNRPASPGTHPAAAAPQCAHCQRGSSCRT